MARSRAMSLYAVSGGLDMPGGVEAALLGFHLREEAAASDEPFASEMYEDFEWLAKYYLPKGTPQADLVGSVVTSALLKSIRDWVTDPEEWATERDDLRIASVAAVNVLRIKAGLSPVT
jgi:hypothetical protein